MIGSVLNSVTDMRVITCLITIFFVIFFFRTVFLDVRNFIIFILLMVVIFQMSLTETVVVFFKNLSHAIGNIAYTMGDYIETGRPSSSQEA